jgi:hypothetical protein
MVRCGMVRCTTGVLCVAEQLQAVVVGSGAGEVWVVVMVWVVVVVEAMALWW